MTMREIRSQEGEGHLHQLKPQGYVQRLKGLVHEEKQGSFMAEPFQVSPT
jgi:hypothetical protein